MSFPSNFSKLLRSKFSVFLNVTTKINHFVLLSYRILGGFYLLFCRSKANSIREIIDWSSLLCTYYRKKKECANRHACRSCFYRTPCICHCLVAEPRFIDVIMVIRRLPLKWVKGGLSKSCSFYCRKFTMKLHRWMQEKSQDLFKRNIYIHISTLCNSGFFSTEAYGNFDSIWKYKGLIFYINDR